MVEGFALHRPRCRLIVAIIATAMSLGGWIYGGSQVLRSHTGSGFRVERSQLAGERDLNLLARQRAREDAWLFMNGTWTDVGYDEKQKSVSIDLEAVKAAVKRSLRGRSDPALRRNSLMVFYHIHPFTEDPQMADPLSLADIHALAAVKEVCRLTGGAEAIGAMFDGRGKWLFDLTPVLEARILEDEHVQSSHHADPADYAEAHGWVHHADSVRSFDIEFSPVAWGALLGNRSRSRTERIQTFIREAESLGVIVTYDKLREGHPAVKTSLALPER